MDSPYQQYLGTSHVPSIDEKRKIQDFLRNSVKELGDINLEIGQLQRRLMLLQEKRSKVSDFIEQHQALISPVRRHDHDVLEQIFLACLPAGRNPCISTSKAPMLLTHIYSSWRNIALCTPRLWAAIHIVLPDINSARLVHLPEDFQLLHEDRVTLKLAQCQTATKKWLERSRGYPLFISLHQSTVLGDLAANTYNGIRKREPAVSVVYYWHLDPTHSALARIDVHTFPQLFKGFIQNEITAERMQMLKKLHITLLTTTMAD